MNEINFYFVFVALVRFPQNKHKEEHESSFLSFDLNGMNAYSRVKEEEKVKTDNQWKIVEKISNQFFFHCENSYVVLHRINGSL